MELVGKVQSDLTIKVMSAADFGTDIGQSSFSIAPTHPSEKQALTLCRQISIFIIHLLM